MKGLKSLNKLKFYLPAILAQSTWIAAFMCVTVSNCNAFEWSNPDLPPSKWSYQIGVDTWHIKADVAEDTYPGYVEDRSYLLLPDYNTKWSYHNPAAYGWAIGSTMLTPSITSNIKVQVNQMFGLRIDEAQIEKKISPYLSFRAGVVDYKTSWCRSYEADTVWMRDVEPLCNLQTFRDITGGAPGAQVVVQNHLDPYVVQAQIGIYRPKAFGYAPQEFGDLYPVPDTKFKYTVNSNNKTGVNINILDLYRSIEARFSYIYGIQEAYAPDETLKSTTRQANKATYAAISFPILNKVTANISHFTQIQNATCRSDIAPYSSCNLNAFFKKTFKSMDASYPVNQRHTIGIGITKINYDFRQDNYDPITQFQTFLSAIPRSIDITQKNLGWRMDFGNGLFTQLQYIKSKQSTSIYGEAYPSAGRALGLRIGYQF